MKVSGILKDMASFVCGTCSCSIIERLETGMQIPGGIQYDSKGGTPDSRISMIAESYSLGIIGHSNWNGIDSSNEVVHDIAEQEDPYSNLLTLTRTVLLLATFRLRSDR